MTRQYDFCSMLKNLVEANSKLETEMKIKKLSMNKFNILLEARQKIFEEMVELHSRKYGKLWEALKKLE